MTITLYQLKKIKNQTLIHKNNVIYNFAISIIQLLKLYHQNFRLELVSNEHMPSV